jgi:hypothetical protein
MTKFPKPKRIIETWHQIQEELKCKEPQEEEELPAITSEEIVEVAKKYPEFAELFKSISVNSDEPPEDEWISEFNGLMSKRFGWSLN